MFRKQHSVYERAKLKSRPNLFLFVLLSIGPTEVYHKAREWTMFRESRSMKHCAVRLPSLKWTSESSFGKLRSCVVFGPPPHSLAAWKPWSFLFFFLLQREKKEYKKKMHASERVRWTPAACFAPAEVDNCFQLVRYLPGQKGSNKVFLQVWITLSAPPPSIPSIGLITLAARREAFWKVAFK